MTTPRVGSVYVYATDLILECVLFFYNVWGEVFCCPTTNRWAWACEKLDFDDPWKSESASKLPAVTHTYIYTAWTNMTLSDKWVEQTMQNTILWCIMLVMKRIRFVFLRSFCKYKVSTQRVTTIPNATPNDVYTHTRAHIYMYIVYYSPSADCF